MKNNITLKEAISIGVGGMVGGGIFAVLGLAVSLAKGGTPIAFLLAGIIALITSYSYIKLSLSFPDKGGTVKFINIGFGRSIFSGSINNLLWISYIIMLSLYASAFGSYAPNLWEISMSPKINFHIYASSIILFATFINYYSIKVVAKIESYAVIIKVVILLLFIMIGVYGLFGNPNLEQLDFRNWESPFHLITGGMVIFVAYEGFELIANAAPNIEDPKINIPKAYYYSVAFVIMLYIIIAIVTVGSLPFQEIAKAQDYVLAEAARPLLGKTGFSIITIAALISTFSAINASLYGGSRVSYEIAEDDELPHEFTRKFWNQPVGLVITTLFTLIITNSIDLESISTTGSISFLFVFGLVNYIAFKQSKKINARKFFPLLGLSICSIALLALIVQQYSSNRTGIIISFIIILSCFILEFIFKKNEEVSSAKQKDAKK